MNNNTNYTKVIDAIAPLYNNFKTLKHQLKGHSVIEIMWDIGDILAYYIDQNNIPPNTLFRMIYGKSESKNNIEQKSYISREFQSRCFRIRRMFKERSEIKEMFPNLKNVTPFREAMPFFDNPDFILKDKEKKDLLNLLNSNLPSVTILKRIGKLQNEKIGIKNPRTQRLHELENAKMIFIAFYNQVYGKIQDGDYLRTATEINTEFYIILSKNTSALCQDGLMTYNIKIPKKSDKVSKQYALMLRDLLQKNTAKERRRFRKVISPERIAKLAEMIYTLTDKTLFHNFIGKNKNHTYFK